MLTKNALFYTVNKFLPPQLRSYLVVLKYKLPLLMSKERRAILRSMMQISSKRPLRIGIEAVSVCNSKCVFCAYQKLPHKNEVLDMPTFIKICEEFDAIGGGLLGFDPLLADPLLDPHLLERLVLLKNKYPKIVPHIFTNGIHFSHFTDEDLLKILRSISSLNISMGGLNRDHYRIMFGVDKFDSVWTTLQRISKMVKDNDLSCQLSVHLRTHRLKETLASPEIRELNSMGYICNDIIDAFQSWGDLVTEADVPEGAKLLQNDNRFSKIPCLVPMIHPKILPNGDVVACGCRDANKVTKIGNIKQESLLEMWHGKKLRLFRESFTKGRQLPICRTCAMYAPYDKFLSNKGLKDYNLQQEFWSVLR